MIHLAEGTDAVAQAEFGQLQTLGVATPRTVLIHGVGMTPSDQHTAIKNGCSLVWCPSTNEYLLNTIADITLWARAKRLLLGSDSRLTATGDLLDELRTAYATGQVSPQALLGLVTRAPYEVLGVDSHWDFRPGAWADIIALPIQDDPWLALVEARRARLSFILRHGRVMLADPPLGQMWPHFKSPASITLDNHPKLLDKRVAEKLRHADLQEPGLVWS
jgi:cytosine/adenosine deaminase-related metal-dependent hydrolase